jgi:hypothetical protein
VGRGGREGHREMERERGPGEMTGGSVGGGEENVANCYLVNPSRGYRSYL